MKNDDSKKTTTKDNEVVSIEPPMSAVISMIVMLSTAIKFLPQSLDEINKSVDQGVFTRRLYPDAVSLNSLIAIRFLFGLFCLSVTVHAVLFANDKIKPTYLKPYSKLRDDDTYIHLKGKTFLYPFTCWSWNLLGLYFFVSSYIAAYSEEENTTKQLTTLALISWKIAAPTTLLIGAIVKYALWPAALKNKGKGNHNFINLRPLLQHNANIVMALTELLFLGGIPLKGNETSLYKHLPLPLLFGVAYVFFSWSTLRHWNPKGIPAALYFFMDPTLGWRHTISLWILLFVLGLFYTIYCAIEALSTSGSSTTTSVLMFLVVCFVTCRFRD